MVIGQTIIDLESIIEKYGVGGFLIFVMGMLAYYLVRSLREMGAAVVQRHEEETRLSASLVDLIERAITAYSENRVVIEQNARVVEDAAQVIKSLYDSHMTLISELREVRQELVGGMSGIKQQLYEAVPNNMRINVIGEDGKLLRGTAKTLVGEDGTVNLIIEIQEDIQEIDT